ncbi:suppressor of fused domain protein [Mycobacterium sp. CnD-18-1]|uniref:suppressor of fused domain protein n=1 Tax=Mycobacterium sp. CnD-18-1 TaxID=2917744 RepID=UPI0021109339|nr:MULTISPECIES: suppressor of fused domain protein [Mycobacterium]
MSPCPCTERMFGEDPQLAQIDTGFGPLRFVQLVGATADTLAAAQSQGDGVQGTLQMLESMAESNPLLVTDIRRGVHLK